MTKTYLIESNGTSVVLYNSDNMKFNLINKKANLIYADMIYENENFDWVNHYWDLLEDDGVFQVQTDDHTIYQLKLYMDKLPKANFINNCIYINEWGGTPKKGFPNKKDYILIYSKGKDFYWDKEPIQIPKATAGTAFDKKGTGLKTPCDVFLHKVSFSTISRERIKLSNGKNIPWQKPLWLMYTLFAPFVKKGDLILDPFMGSGSAGIMAIDLECNYMGIEMNKEIYNIAENRLEQYLKQKYEGDDIKNESY